MTTQVPTVALKRLRRDYNELIKEPVQFITAHPLESNILEWHYVLSGPPDSPYAGGIYHGRVDFPPQFPYKPPAIRMLTPSGRFAVNTRICLSMSDYHPETWSPLWTVSAVLNGLLSYMVSISNGAGCVNSSAEQKKLFARRSWQYNLKNKTFCELFPDLAAEAKTKE